MRIATGNAYEKGIDTLGHRQSDLFALQEQMTSGKRVARASDDPAAAARAERATAAIGRSTTSQRAVEASKVAMTQAESGLGQATELVQRARELMLSGGNTSYTDTDRASIGRELQSIRTALLAIANQSDGAGNFLFGGQGAATRPFVDTASGVQFSATAGQRRGELDTGLPLTADGRTAFLGARTGNGVFVTGAGAMVQNATIDAGSVSDPSALTGAAYTLRFAVSGGATTYAVLKNGAPTAVTAAPYVAGQSITVDGMSVAVSGAPATGDEFSIAPSTPTQSIFAVLDRAAKGLLATGRTPSQVAQATADNLRDVDSAGATIASARSAAGEVLNRIDSETDRLADAELAGRTDRSNAEDVDMVHAVSEFQSKQSGYDAALKSYAVVQRLSLFQYVNGG